MTFLLYLWCLQTLRPSGVNDLVHTSGQPPPAALSPDGDVTESCFLSDVIIGNIMRNICNILG